MLEIVCESAVKIRSINYNPVNIEPCIVLRGKWLRLAGFPVGDKVTITINQQEISITPKPLGSGR